MGLCNYCLSLPVALFDRSGTKVWRASHQPSYSSLEASGAQGCQLCVLLLDSIKRNFPGCLDNLTKEPQQEGFSLRSDTAGQYLEVGTWVVGIIDGRIAPDDFEDGMKTGDKPEELETVRRWLHICETNHQTCKKSSPTYVPTRLVNVNLPNKDEVQLAQLKNQKVSDKRYLALSHCWGLNMPASALLKVANLEDHLKMIPLSDLPLTFRDAISIARELGVPYVWIDSMCMIQDSAEDWEVEAADMTSVYSEAFLTIVATSSTNSSQGCRTDPASIPPGPVILSCSRIAESTQITRKVRIFPSDYYLHNFRSQPLHERGWTLQERELSPKLLFYTKDTIRWECSCLKASLRFPWSDALCFSSEVFAQGPTRWRDTYTSSNPTSEEMKIEAARQWRKMACKFMDRKLTFRADVLPAIAGMARLVGESTGDTYLAGLWRDSLERSLLWESNWDSNYKTVRPAEFYAPTWSWASIVGPISYHDNHDSASPEGLQTGDVLKPEILEAVTQPEGRDIYGRLKSGHLRLSGIVKATQVRGHQDDGYNVLTIWDGEKKVGNLVFDVYSDLPEEQNFEIMCLYFRPASGTGRGTKPTGLALRPYSGDIGSPYKRFGLLFSMESEWFAEEGRQIITII